MLTAARSKQKLEWDDQDEKACMERLSTRIRRIEFFSTNSDCHITTQCRISNFGFVFDQIIKV